MSEGLTVLDLMAKLRACPPEMRVVAGKSFVGDVTLRLAFDGEDGAVTVSEGDTEAVFAKRPDAKCYGYVVVVK